MVFLPYILVLYSGFEGSFAEGAEPGAEVHVPMFMSFNSLGLQLSPAVYMGSTNRVDLNHLRIPTSQVREGLFVDLVCFRRSSVY